MKPTLEPSSVGSKCTRNGRLQNGVSTTPTPAGLLLDTQTTRPCFCLHRWGSTTLFTRWVLSTLTS